MFIFVFSFLLIGNIVVTLMVFHHFLEKRVEDFLKETGRLWQAALYLLFPLLAASVILVFITAICFSISRGFAFDQGTGMMWALMWLTPIPALITAIILWVAEFGHLYRLSKANRNVPIGQTKTIDLKIIIIASIILLLIIAGGAINVFSFPLFDFCFGRQVVHSAEIPGWKVYRNKEYDFEISLPKIYATLRRPTHFGKELPPLYLYSLQPKHSTNPHFSIKVIFSTSVLYVAQKQYSYNPISNEWFTSSNFEPSTKFKPEILESNDWKAYKFIGLSREFYTYVYAVPLKIHGLMLEIKFFGDSQVDPVMPPKEAEELLEKIVSTLKLL